jgi:hypothetical protein
MFVSFSDVKVRSDLLKYTYAKLVKMQDYCTVCTNYVSKNHCCGLSPLPINCKYCSKESISHSHDGFFGNLTPKSDIFESIYYSPFSTRLNNDTMFYFMTLFGTVTTVDAQILAPCLRTIITDEDKTLFTYNLPYGTYLLYSSHRGSIRTGEDRYEHTQENMFLGLNKSRAQDSVNFYDSHANHSQCKRFIQRNAISGMTFVGDAEVAHYDPLTNKLTITNIITKTTQESQFDDFVQSIDVATNEIHDAEEQNDDEASTDAGSDPAAVATPIVRNELDDTNFQPKQQIFKGGDTKLANQAIDVGFNFGPDSARQTVETETPEGKATAIPLAVNDLKEESIDYNLSHPLPAFANCWQTIPVNDNQYTPDFNNRTKYVMDMFTSYRSSLVWRIVAKPSLFQAQQFWVSFNPTIDGIPSTYGSANNLVGFNWNPSEQNEIYVVTPWSSLGYMTSVTDFTQLGQLIITPRTNLITESGLPDPMQIFVYCAPKNMKLFTPQPITIDEVPAAKFYHVTKSVKDTDSFTLSSVDNVFCSLVDGGYSLATAADYSIVVGTNNLLQHVSTGCNLSTVSSIGLQNVTVNLPVSSTLSMAMISTKVFYVDGVVAQPSNTILYSAVGISDPVTISNYTSMVVSPSWPTSLAALTINYVDDTGNGIFLDTTSSSINKSLSVNQQEWTGPVTFTAAATVGVLYNSASETSPTLVNSITIHGEEQMFKYSYNPTFQKNREVYGVTRDHTPRLDNQYSLVATHPLANSDDSVTFDFLNPDEGFANFDRDRHLMFSKYPILKLESASNPASNMLLRITQKQTAAELTLDQCYQLPGFDWDPKTGPRVFQPYWTSVYPAEFSDLASFHNPAFIQVNTIGGTYGTTIELIMWYCPQTMDYHNMIGFASTATPSTLKVKPLKHTKPTQPIPRRRPQKLIFGGIEQMDDLVSQTSDVAELPADGTVVQSEARWNYVASFKTPASTSIISIPVNSRLLGPWAYRNAARFGRWHGNLRVKVMVNNSFLANGNFHVIHSNTHVLATDTIDTDKFVSVLGDIGHSVMGAPGSAVELQLDWRTTVPKLAMDHNSNRSDNGYLLICIPVFSVSPTATELESNITIYSDSSNLQYSLPRSSTVTGDYLPINFVTASRS